MFIFLAGLEFIFLAGLEFIAQLADDPPAWVESPAWLRRQRSRPFATMKE